MTRNHVPVDDHATLQRILAGAAALLLDFDGPICSVFAGFPAPVVAEQLREVLAEGGHNELPPEVQSSDDPFEVLNFAAIIGGDEARYVEATLQAHEVEAVATAAPTPGAHDLFREWSLGDRALAIVSNNSAAAVDAYLHQHGLTSYVRYVSARTEPDTSLLKPSPYLLHQACEALGVDAAKCVLIGDSLTDIQAAQGAEIPVIGYANKPGKKEMMQVARSDAVVTSISSVLNAL